MSEKGPVCGIDNCRSQRYEEGEDGYLYCQNGHRSTNLVHGEDENDFNPLVHRQRTKKPKEEKEKVYAYYTGQKAFDHYLKCLQLVLRYQIKFLVQDRGLPVELETIIFDLWSLRLVRFENRINANADDDDSQSQMFSTQSEEDPESDMEATKSAKRAKRLHQTPTLLDSLALCYLGITTLRLPITTGDLYGWTMGGKMPYFRAINTLPAAMAEKLPPFYSSSFRPNALLKPERLFRAIIGLATVYQQEYGVQWPALNHTPLLYRYIRELALPLEAYTATRRLCSLLHYTFKLPISTQRPVGVRYLPDAQLIAALVVSVKLIYPFDNEKRYPKTASEPAATAINWANWYRHMTSARKNDLQDRKGYKAEEFAKIQEKDVFAMSENQLDQYMDWYMRTFLDDVTLEENDSAFRSNLHKMFPIDKEVPSLVPTDAEAEVAILQQQVTDTIKAVHGRFRAIEPVAGDEERQNVLRPGDRYRHYRTEKDLPESARRFYEEAARVSGLSMDMLLSAVFMTEKNIQKWRQQQRRKAKEAAQVE